MTNIIAPVPVNVCQSKLKEDFKKVGQGFHRTFSVAGKALTATQAKTDGFFRFIKFLISGAEFTLVFVPDISPLALMKGKFSEFKGVVEAFHLIPRSKEVFVDELYTRKNWKESAFMKCKMASRAFLTVGHSLSLVKFLRAIKLVKFDKIGLGWLGANVVGKLPLFELIQMGSIWVSSVFGIGYKGITLHNAVKDTGKSSILQARSNLANWEKIGKELGDGKTPTACKDKLIQDYEKKLKEGSTKKGKNTVLKLKIAALKNGDAKKLADYKISRLSLKLQHRKFEKKNAIIGIAVEVSKISILTLSMVLMGMSLTTGFVPVLALASVGMIANGLGWLGFLYAEMGKPATLPKSTQSTQLALAAPAA